MLRSRPLSLAIKARINPRTSAPNLAPLVSPFTQHQSRIQSPTSTSIYSFLRSLHTTPKHHASHTSSPPSPTPPATPSAANAQLRDGVETELSLLRARIAGLGGAAPPDTAWLRALTPDEVGLVNLGQVPYMGDGADVVALLDLDLKSVLPPLPLPEEIERAGGDKSGHGESDSATQAQEALSSKQPARKDGTGVHVPLLALAGTTEPAVPCYPISELFGTRGLRVAGKVRDVLAAQVQREAAAKASKAAKAKGAQEGSGSDAGTEPGSGTAQPGSAGRFGSQTLLGHLASPLVAIVVPPSGPLRDIGMPLAISLYRLAMAEGNGQEEGVM